MTTNQVRRGRRWLSWVAGVAAAIGLSAAPSLAADQELPAYVRCIHEGEDPASDPNIVQAGCAGCGGGLLRGPAPMLTGPVSFGGGCGDGGCGGCPTGHCRPGQYCPGSGCGGHHPDTHIGRFFGGIYECLCCPDPCYEPKWIALGNAGLFLDHARPQNTTMFRWDAGLNGNRPDRNAWFFPRAGRRGFNRAVSEVDYHELNMYVEAGTNKFSFFINTPYRNVDTIGVQQNGNPENYHKSGFGDLTVGTKSVLVDCELLLLTFQFKTYTPTGLASNGMGTGSLALEPSLLASLKLSPNMYLESQLSQWIPIANGFDAGIFHYHFALNRTLCHIGALHVIGSGSFDAYTFQGGSYTIPSQDFPTAPFGRDTFASMGPGIRFVYCDNIDLGFGASFSLTDQRFAEQLYRTEFRVRF